MRAKPATPSAPHRVRAVPPLMSHRVMTVMTAVVSPVLDANLAVITLPAVITRSDDKPRPRGLATPQAPPQSRPVVRTPWRLRPWHRRLEASAGTTPCGQPPPREKHTNPAW